MGEGKGELRATLSLGGEPSEVLSATKVAQPVLWDRRTEEEWGQGGSGDDPGHSSKTLSQTKRRSQPSPVPWKTLPLPSSPGFPGREV